MSARNGKLTVLPVENLSMMREVNIAYNRDFANAEILKELVELYGNIMAKA